MEAEGTVPPINITKSVHIVHIDCSVLLFVCYPAGGSSLLAQSRSRSPMHAHNVARRQRTPRELYWCRWCRPTTTVTLYCTRLVVGGFPCDTDEVL